MLVCSSTIKQESSGTMKTTQLCSGISYYKSELISSDELQYKFVQTYFVEPLDTFGFMRTREDTTATEWLSWGLDHLQNCGKL